MGRRKVKNRKNSKTRLSWAGVALVLAGGLPFFLLKYVPLISPFLEILLVLSGLVLMVTFYREDWGVILFVFLFPLVNSLPYFFEINLNIPHAPTACVIFLFFLLGWSIRSALSSEIETTSSPLRWPLIFISGLIVISGIITFLRFSAFFPFRADGLYEFKTNVTGVTSGGALMSTLFSGLNYLSGFFFFIILFKLIKKRRQIVSPLFFALALATVISCCFGFIQRFVDLSWGNTPFWVRMNQVNATFKDPNAFAFFLSGVGPLLVGLFLWEKKRRRFFFLFALMVTLSIFPFIGNRSSFLGLMIALFIFFIVLMIYGQGWLKKKLAWGPRAFLVLQGIIIFLLVGVLVGGGFLASKTLLYQRLKNSVSAAIKNRSLVSLSPERYFLWREALLMIKDYPLSGVGLGAYIVELPNYYAQERASFEGAFQGWQRNDSAENYFLHVGAELGVVGFVFWGWLFWLIGRQAVWVASSKIKEKEEDREIRKKDALLDSSNNKAGVFQMNYVAISLSLSLVALVVNYLFHSYVGTFESKFLFWGLTALLFGLGFGRGDGRGDGRKKGVVLLLVSASFIVFTTSNIWQATHSLSLSSRTSKLKIDQNFGWYSWEEDEEGRRFQWSRSYGGRMVKVENPYLEFKLLASHPDIQQNPVIVKIYLMKDFFKQRVLLAELKLDNRNWHHLEIKLPQEVVGQKVIILFKVSRTWVPLREIGAPDPRRLGVAVTPFKFIAG